MKPLKDSTKAGVLSVVRRMINKNNENYHIGNLVEANVSHNSAISASDCLAIVPQIPLITASTPTQCQRRGNKLIPKSLVVKGLISLRTDQLTTLSPIMVRVMILAQKNIKTGSQVNAGNVSTNQLLECGFTTSATSDEIPFSGNTPDLMVPINKDLFRVYYDRKIKLSPPLDGSLDCAPTMAASWSYRFKQLPSHLTFDEANGDWVNNFAPFIAIGYAYMDGTTPDVLTTRLVSNTYSLLHYEDA